MLTGRKYRLGKATLAMEIVEDERKLLTIPADAVIQVLSGPAHHHNDALAQVHWQGKTVSMFAIDIAKRGTHLLDKNATA